MVESCTPPTFEISLGSTLLPHSVVTNRMHELAIVIGFRPARTPSSTVFWPQYEHARCSGTDRARWLQIREMSESRSVEAAP